MEYEIGDCIKMIARIDKRKLHLIAVVEGQFVYKWYSYIKKRWKYGIDGPGFFDVCIREEIAKLIKGKGKKDVS